MRDLEGFRANLDGFAWGANVVPRATGSTHSEAARKNVDVAGTRSARWQVWAVALHLFGTSVGALRDVLPSAMRSARTGTS